MVTLTLIIFFWNCWNVYFFSKEQKFVKENIASSRIVHLLKWKWSINYLADTCQSFQGTKTVPNQQWYRFLRPFIFVYENQHVTIWKNLSPCVLRYFISKLEVLEAYWSPFKKRCVLIDDLPCWQAFIVSTKITRKTPHGDPLYMSFTPCTSNANYI